MYNQQSTGSISRTLKTPVGGDDLPVVLIRSGTAGQAESHGAIPMVAFAQTVTFEPGIAAREGGHIYEGVSGTIRANAGDNRMAVCYPDVVDGHILDDQGGSQITVREDGKSPTLRAEMHGNVPCVLDSACLQEPQAVPYRQGGFGDYVEGEVGGGSENLIRQEYIVRRLTPTECARLQGFPDWWGHISEKTDMTDEEYRFWLEVRNTHARINGKAEKEYTEAQMITWYNKLHTDGAEFKMWGNGLALPPALYCMLGIAEALERDEDAWLL